MVFVYDGDELEVEEVFGEDADLANDIIIDSDISPARTIRDVRNVLKAFGIEVSSEWLAYVEEFLDSDADVYIDFTA